MLATHTTNSAVRTGIHTRRYYPVTELPAVIRRVPRFDCDECAGPDRGDLAGRGHRRFDRRAIICCGDDVRIDMDGSHWRRSLENAAELRGHTRRRVIEPLLPHEMMDGGPIHVAVEDGADDA